LTGPGQGWKGLYTHSPFQGADCNPGGNKMEHTMWIFISVLLLTFGLFLILAGAFTAYFGSGKSRAIGVGLLVFGIVMGVVVLLMYQLDIVPIELEFWTVVKEALVYIGAALVGAAIAIGVFLVAIMKS
jgi:uncharacterized membrane-anchored protein